MSTPIAMRTRSRSLLPRSGGVVLVEPWLSACPRGYRRAFALAQAHAAGPRLFAIEGTGSSALGLARFLARAGRAGARGGSGRRGRGCPRGKSDALDAVRAARAVFSGLRTSSRSHARAAGGPRCKRPLRRARGDRRPAGRRSVSYGPLIVTAPPALREELRSLTRARLLRRCATTAAGRCLLEQRGTLLALRLLARRIRTARQEESGHSNGRSPHSSSSSRRHCSSNQGLDRSRPPRSPVAWSHHRRLRSEAAFARLAGTPPIPATSGLLVRHRLDRGGDRPLNRALHTVIDQPPKAPCADDRLHRAPPRRRENHPRSDPLPQTLTSPARWSDRSSVPRGRWTLMRGVPDAPGRGAVACRAGSLTNCRPAHLCSSRQHRAATRARPGSDPGHGPKWRRRRVRHA